MEEKTIVKNTSGVVFKQKYFPEAKIYVKYDAGIDSLTVKISCDEHVKDDLLRRNAQIRIAQKCYHKNYKCWHSGDKKRYGYNTTNKIYRYRLFSPQIPNTFPYSYIDNVHTGIPVRADMFSNRFVPLDPYLNMFFLRNHLLMIEATPYFAITETFKAGSKKTLFAGQSIYRKFKVVLTINEDGSIHNRRDGHVEIIEVDSIDAKLVAYRPPSNIGVNLWWSIIMDGGNVQVF